jgi:Hg(II)-responsive transcriptional regulator
MRTMQVAERAGVNAQTLRYYERRGLLPDPPRTASGYRAYGPEAVRIVRFVKRAQELGFSLTEVEVLLHLADGGPESCDMARQLAENKVADLDTKIATLNAMRASLSRLIATCGRPPRERDCPLLDSLEPDPDRNGRS